jgi:hypothetical protein
MARGVGFRIRVRLYSGKVVEAEITAITNPSAGRKVQIVYGNVNRVDQSATPFCQRLRNEVCLGTILVAVTAAITSNPNF